MSATWKLGWHVRHVRRSRLNFPGMPVALFSSGRKSASLGHDKTSNRKSQTIDVNPPKGTRDFFPEEYRLQHWLYGIWRDSAWRHGFEEYDAPVVENTSLYTRKSGEEITQQLYTFADKSGRQLSLRPEMTPSLARMVLAKGKSLSLPIKWFSIPQCWRYEKMSKGRRREHYQWNMDIWGVASIEAEAEILSAMVFSLKSMGLTSKDVGIKVNSKHIITSILELHGIAEDLHPEVCMVIDKWDKVPKSVIKDEIQKILPDSDSQNITSLLETINMKDNIEKFKNLLGSKNKGVCDIVKLLLLSESYGYRDWLLYDATIVRGLSYYTGVVFEAFDRKGELRAICGGGRYDHLLDSFSGKEKTVSIPAVGFGFGDAVIVELLKSKGLVPDMSNKRIVDVVVCFLSVGGESLETRNALQNLAINAATELRDQGIKVDLIMECKKAKWMYQRADKLNAACTLMFGGEELAQNSAALKDMKEGSQASVSRISIVDEIKTILNRS